MVKRVRVCLVWIAAAVLGLAGLGGYAAVRLRTLRSKLPF